MVSSQGSYVSNTNPEPYDQIIVISQKIINAGFKEMWKMAQGDDDSPLKHFKKSFHGESIDSDVGVPSVRFHVESREPMLYFLLSLTSGELTVFKSDEGDDTFTWDIKDWVLAFNVDINQKSITKDSEEYKQFKNRAGLPESDFSLAQLFIDSSASTKLDMELSTFGDHRIDDVSADTRASLDGFIKKWLDWATEHGSSILGYSAQREEGSDELNGYAPSFPPTAIDYFTYPWQGDSGDSQRNDGPDQNALAYLLTSNFDTPPAEGSISYTGPWVDTKDHEATFCMSGGLFWPWIMPLMRDLAMAMTPVPENATVYWDGTPEDKPWRSAPNWHIGASPSSDDDYKWIPAPDDRYSWKATSPMLWTSAQDSNPKDDSDYEVGEEWGDNIEAVLSYEEGTEAITLSGSSKFRYQLDHVRTKYDPTSFWVEVYASWSLVINMASIEEGGIIFQIPNDHEVETWNKSYGDILMDETPDDLAREIEESLRSSMNSALDGVDERLTNVLANANRLCLPATGTFFMNDPIFNRNGDLLVNLKYDGADPPAAPRKGKYRLRPKTLKP